MSYDLVVFDPAAPPREKAAFLAWYRKQTQWDQPLDYLDPANATPALRAWFLEMVQHFPPLSGPRANCTDDDEEDEDGDGDEDEDDLPGAEYSITPSMIYACFPWSQADHALQTVIDLAQKHRIGFFNASSNACELWFPVAGEGYEEIK